MKKILKERNSKRNHKLFSKLLENQNTPLRELDVPKMTAWQTVEEEEIEESSYLPAGGEEKIDRFMKPMSSVTNTVDTKQEAAEFIKKVLVNVKELVGDKLTPQEIMASLKLVLKDMAAASKGVASDIADDIGTVVDQNEAHVVLDPDNDDEKRKTSEAVLKQPKK
tara:strand:- start:6350 stop:6847 length:498 start_codon:yes stop_codon:yes gene_type:complete